MLLENTRIGDIITSEQLEAIQPRPFEGCFAHVNENHAINIFFIQQFDLILERLLGFMENELELVYKSFNGLPVLALKYGYLVLAAPVFNSIPKHDILTLCSLEYPDLHVNQIKRYQLPDALIRMMQDDIDAYEGSTESAYEHFDTLDEDETNKTIFEEGYRCTLQPLQ